MLDPPSSALESRGLDGFFPSVTVCPACLPACLIEGSRAVLEGRRRGTGGDGWGDDQMKVSRKGPGPLIG